MALPSTSITTAAVGAEISSSSHSVGTLVGAAGLNKYSLYAPGTIGPDANEDLIITPPTSNYKLGDFRLYDHSAAAPAWVAPPSGFLYYGPGSVANPTFSIIMNWLNIACSTVHSEIIDSSGTPWQYYLTLDVYNTDPARTTGTSPVKTWTIAINMVNSGFTVLSGHSRDMSGKYIMNTGANLFYPDDIAVSGTCTRYFEAYFSDGFGARKMNFGTRGAGYPGYIDIEFRENQAPVAYSGSNFNAVGQSNPPDTTIGGTPYSWTYAAPQICSTGTRLTTDSPITMPYSADVDFYIKILGITNGAARTNGVTSADIYLDYGPNGNDYADLLATGVSWAADSNGYQINTTLGGGRTWQYNWTGTVKLGKTGERGTSTVYATDFYPLT